MSTLHFIHAEDEPRECKHCDGGWQNLYQHDPPNKCGFCNGTGKLGREGHEPEIEVKFRAHRSLGHGNHGWYWRTHHRPPDAGWQPGAPHYGRPYSTAAKALAAAREALG